MIPRFVRKVFLENRLARSFLRWTPNFIFYAGTAGLISLRRGARILRMIPTPAQQTFMTDFDKYESLFKGSVEKLAGYIRPYAEEFKWFVGQIYNGQFQSVDAELYYAIIRKHQPQLIVEVGSGHSTFFARDAVKKNGCGAIVCIDPNPLRRAPKGVRCIESRGEDVDVAIFRQLEANDILFFDSSHLTAEANYHVTKILPQLKAGVIIQHHDFAFPWVRYYHDDPQKYGEPDVLLDFYYNHRENFEILSATSYVQYRDPELVRRLIKSRSWCPEIPALSLWTRKM